jgi:hypothetical protein
MYIYILFDFITKIKMLTRSKITTLLPKIDFIEASKEWMKNKKKMGNGTYEYIKTKTKTKTIINNI